jgi:predicted  nucleic acid-binding Zn-ribbon protein
MKLIRRLLPISCLVALVACDTKAKEQLRTLAHTDSVRTDSLVSIKNDLLNEVMTSTQFVNDLNTEMVKLKSRKPAKLSTTLSRESDMSAIKEERAAVVSRIRELIARLDSSEARVTSLRARAAKLSQHDSTVVAQVAAYEKTIADLRQAVEQQKVEYEATIAKQNTQILALNSKVDTVTKANVKLAGEKVALIDTVSQLTVEKNTAYYVVGTKDDLIRAGVLVEEGRKRFMVVGGRPVSAARDLDPSKFTKIDRLRDRVINVPEGDYSIFTRQNPAFASPFSSKDGKFSGGLRIDQPERFWEPSKFLIIVKG